MKDGDGRCNSCPYWRSSNDTCERFPEPVTKYRLQSCGEHPDMVRERATYLAQAIVYELHNNSPADFAVPVKVQGSHES